VYRLASSLFHRPRRDDFLFEKAKGLCVRKWGLAFSVLVAISAAGCLQSTGLPHMDPVADRLRACKNIVNLALTLNPSGTTAGSSNLTITITEPSHGDGFSRTARVLWNGSQNGVSTSQLDGFTLTAQISPVLVADPGTAHIMVGQQCESSSSLDFFSPAMDFVISPAPLEITTTTLPGATLNLPYPVTTLHAAGGRPGYTFAASGLPPGLELSGDGQLSGVPATVEGTPFSVQFQVTDGSHPAQTAHKTIGLTVSVAPLEITTALLPSGLVNTSYSATLAATGGIPPYSGSIPANQLPSGLTLNTSTGVISGVPSNPANASLPVTVRDSSNPPQTISRTLALSVTASGPFISSHL
jgi:hypothetical protein